MSKQPVRLTRRGEALLTILAGLSLGAFISLGGFILAAYVTLGR